MLPPPESSGSIWSADGARGWVPCLIASSSVRFGAWAATPYTSSPTSAAPARRPGSACMDVCLPSVGSVVRGGGVGVHRWAVDRRSGASGVISGCSAVVAQLVERELPKLEVAGSRPVRRFRA